MYHGSVCYLLVLMMMLMMTCSTTRQLSEPETELTHDGVMAQLQNDTVLNEILAPGKF